MSGFSFNSLIAHATYSCAYSLEDMLIIDQPAAFKLEAFESDSFGPAAFDGTIYLVRQSLDTISNSDVGSFLDRFPTSQKAFLLEIMESREISFNEGKRTLLNEIFLSFEKHKCLHDIKMNEEKILDTQDVIVGYHGNSPERVLKPVSIEPTQMVGKVHDRLITHVEKQREGSANALGLSQKNLDAAITVIDEKKLDYVTSTDYSAYYNAVVEGLEKLFFPQQ